MGKNHECNHIPVKDNSYSGNFSRLLNIVDLSQLQLSRLAAYLEEKIWTFLRTNLTSCNKILWIREEIAP